MSRKKIEAYNVLIKDMDQKAAAHLVKLGIGKSAKENLKKKSAEELSKVTGGLNLPLDFKMPF